MREIHPTELVTPALYDDNLLRITGIGRPPRCGSRARSTTPTGRRSARAGDRAGLGAALPLAATDITLDLSSLRFIDVAGAVGLVHAAEEFPDTHRLVLVGVRPGVPGSSTAAARRSPPSSRSCPREEGRVRITSTPVATRPPARRRVLRHRGRPPGPARADGRGALARGPAGGAGGPPGGGAARRARVRPRRAGAADPPGRARRPLRPDPGRAPGPRAARAHRDGGPVGMISEHWELDGADGGSGPSSTPPSTSRWPTCRWDDLLLPRDAAAPGRSSTARAAHPPAAARRRQARRPTPSHQSPAERARRAPAPPPRCCWAPPDLQLEFGAWQLNEVRAASSRQLVGVGFGRDRAEDVVLAVNEVATNAVEFGARRRRRPSVARRRRLRAPRCTTAAPCAIRCPASPRRTRPIRAGEVCGSRGRSASRCTCGPTRRAPTSGCVRRRAGMMADRVEGFGASPARPSDR